MSRYWGKQAFEEPFPLMHPLQPCYDSFRLRHPQPPFPEEFTRFRCWPRAICTHCAGERAVRGDCCSECREEMKARLNPDPRLVPVSQREAPRALREESSLNVQALHLNLLSEVFAFLDRGVPQWACLRMVCRAWWRVSTSSQWLRLLHHTNKSAKRLLQQDMDELKTQMWPAITSFTMNMDSSQCAWLVEFTALQSVSFSPKDDAFSLIIEGCPALRSLRLYGVYELKVPSFEFSSYQLEELEIGNMLLTDVCNLQVFSALKYLQIPIADVYVCRKHPSCIQDLLSSFAELSKLRLLDGYIDDALMGVALLPKLEELHLVGCKFGEVGTSRLSSLNQLKSLRVLWCTNSSKACLKLSPFTKLESLDLWVDAAVEINGIDIINLKQLSLLTASSSDTVHFLYLLTNLQHLKLDSLSSDFKSCGSEFGGLTNLVSLELTGHGISDDDFKCLTTLLCLESLNLVDCPRISDVSLQVCRYLPKLQVLSLSRCAITGSGLYGLTGIASLSLTLSAPRDCLASISRWVSQTKWLQERYGLPEESYRLSSLTFFDGSSNIDISHVTLLTGLESLNLFGSGITDEGIASFTTLSRLSHLGLRETKVTRTGLRSLSCLKYLDLDAVLLCDGSLQLL